MVAAFRNNIQPIGSIEEIFVKTRIVKWGNSLAVRIPKTIAEKARLKEGDFLDIETAEGQIELRRAAHVPSLSKLLAQITPETDIVRF